ncbi:LysR family transcriptional regulator [Pseudescherichia sp. L3]|uniref:LysR family transcriptional regulator n=1 Tax=Pseudescherichia sp. L3 TaxID=2970817 RepID=UPI00214F90E5|nr:LysR family transcriptional regulator [Pseudescherichia sp. L3]MCR4457335.1 LysR family transcriptional regulator [Pseudescherichia sp. L3]
MNRKWPHVEDLEVFLAVVRHNSFTDAAVELGFSNAWVTKRIAALEQTLNTKLLHRNTREMRLTAAGEVALIQAEEIIRKNNVAMDLIVNTKKDIKGNLHICSSFGFGKNHLTTPLSMFSKLNPNLKIKLTLTDTKLDLIKENIDLEIMVGEEVHERYYAKKIADNRRILCASSGYLNQQNLPESPTDLAHHKCLFLQEKGLTFGLWHLTNGQKQETVRVEGNLSSNNGEVILHWALDDHGIALRSEWDAKRYIESGDLIQVLPDYYEKASVWALYPNKLDESIKTQKCITFLESYFSDIFF